MGRVKAHVFLGLGFSPTDVEPLRAQLQYDAVNAEVQSCRGAIARGLQHENWPARGFDLTDPSGNHVHVEQPD